MSTPKDQPQATWYLATNLPHPDAPHAVTSPHPSADLAEIVRLYGLRPWTEQSYKQIKDELGWTDFQVRSARAIHRYQTLVNCAFSFCWDQWFASPGPLDATAPDPCPGQESERGTARTPPAPTALLAQGFTGHPFLAHPRLTLNRWWQARTDTDPPSELQALIDAVTTGHGIDLYRRI
ncbi:hypothetical protein F8144_44130 [Streptomyces triticiradicis]|uniref:Transposase n=1 Tax=Streptomyces triticiradicis TaxID=2651189 RepID=A0A7J5D1A3_9ACTN|nr:hypothetical protein [Streptomyces triticiradicis]KAB1973203.1 hypothetical protein F8144_44130 [Streptomyces triticiradicis]